MPKFVPATVIQRQRTLKECAHTANIEHGHVETAIGDVLTHAVKAGEALEDAKAQLKHGEWLAWLSKNFAGSDRHARRYMEISRNWTRVSDLVSMREALRLLAGNDDSPHVAKNSGDNEWYTPEPYVVAAREVLGGFDLDPASSAEANAIVGAEDFYTAEDDGLEQEWHGRVWMNPPYAKDKIGPFTEKLATSFDSGSVSAAIALVNNATETEWFQTLARKASAICFPDGRVRFWKSDGELGAPLQGQAFIYLGTDVERFSEHFGAFGLIAEVRSA